MNGESKIKINMKAPLKERKFWDVIVIGGGASGMMAAGTAAKRGKSVLLLEKNSTLGKKLLITGGGRCNVTNNKKDTRTLLSEYKGNDKFLFSAFSKFSVEDTLNFFNSRGVKTKEENEGRIFPASNKAEDIFNVLYKYLGESNVTIQSDSPVVSVTKEKEGEYFVVKVKKGETVFAKACVIATGGVARPETGSTGEGFTWLEKLGHTVIAPDLALIPIALKDKWPKKLSGLTLPDIKITTFLDDIKQEVHKGKILFTHVGLTGPTILNMSRDIGELLKYGSVKMEIDLFPHLDHGALRAQLQRLLVEQSNKKLKNVLSILIPGSVVGPLLELASIDGETFAHSVKTEDRKKLVDQMKSIFLSVKGLLSEDKAVVSSGGVELKEVNFKTMESRVVPQLYLIGDVLNVDRPSGGYSLQLCWTTGFVAGSNC
ncbi:MAG: NAD(FAD)-utilizing dehydrogenase [Candidatus Nomurabacteria bacterium]|nr:NAD(FAD)-utilizing dehydrogenase [Candidatus Nomurabacteria bacterium]